MEKQYYHQRAAVGYGLKKNLIKHIKIKRLLLTKQKKDGV